MNTDHRNPRLRRGFAFVALAAVLGLSAVGLTQCRLVDDTVTGVDLRSNSVYGDDDDNNNNNNNNGRSACQKRCNEEFKRCKKNREGSHKINKRECDKQPSGKRQECKKGESKKNNGKKKECNDRKKECKRACRYREAAGRVGR
jgi:hypothetical protein